MRLSGIVPTCQFSTVTIANIDTNDKLYRSKSTKPHRNTFASLLQHDYEIIMVYQPGTKTSVGSHFDKIVYMQLHCIS